MLRLNPSSLIIGSPDPAPILGPAIAEIALHTLEVVEDELEQIHGELCDYTKPLY